MKFIFLRELKTLSLWFCLSAFICWPIPLSLQTSLIGDPSIDVWNHAWGYWYVFQHFLAGNLPLQTELIGSPGGGSLYFIDTPGAIISLPIQWVFGTAFAYNVTLLMRVALAGYGAQWLAKELTGEGHHTWIAGLVYASTPFLLCELGNGISEVCATQWLVLAFWATARAIRTQSWKDFCLIGLFQGLCSSATFYYGLTSGIIIGLWLLYAFGSQWLKEKDGVLPMVKGAFLSLFCSILVMAPYAGLFLYSLNADDRLVLRDTSLNDQLLRHNAVDPFIYLMPNDFQSVNLAVEYGEPFLHTGYLRWSVILLGVLGVYRSPKLRFPALLAGLSLILGLGSYLWFAGEWVLLSSGDYISLPFDWLRRLMPQIAITHPLRLSIAAQALFAVFAAGGAHYIGQKIKQKARVGLWLTLGVLVLSESFFVSSATWPLPTSNTEIDAAYQFADPTRNVLDLPAEAGTSMKTSQYFWNQTAHKRPIPYTPDARLGSTRDLQTFRSFIGIDGIHEDPKTPDNNTIQHMRKLYGLIVLHTELDEELADKYNTALAPAFGQAQQSGQTLFWQLDPLDDEEETLSAPLSSTPYSDKGETQKLLVDCDELDRGLEAYIAGQIDLKDALLSCEIKLSGHCAQRLRNPNTPAEEVLFCLEAFKAFPHPDDSSALFQLLRRPESLLKEQAATILEGKSLSSEEQERFQRLMNK